MERGVKKNTYVIFLILIAVVIGAVFIMSLSKNKPVGTERIKLQLISGNFVSPIDVKFSNDGKDRMFVVDRPGIIYLLNGSEKQIFLDIRDRVVNLDPNYDERGLLSLAFHPNFKDNGKFYVFYSAPLRKGDPDNYNCVTTISEFKVMNNNSNLANKSSERIILQFPKPYMNHNGGQLAFGKDNYLYISTGDGGNADDFGLGHSSIGNGQDLTNYMGKILRININAEFYDIPPDNPFANEFGGPKREIYAYGFRNPWRMSFDYENNTLYVGDVGQNLWEEIDIVEKGKNYGWPIKEGTYCFSHDSPNKSPENCSQLGYRNEKLIDPIIEYKNAGSGGIGHANILGFVYHGMINKFNGRLFFGDWSASFTAPEGKLFVATPSDKGLWNFDELQIENDKNGKLNEFLLSFGEDNQKELYILTTEQTGPSGNTGKVYKIINA